ncbi:MAG: group II intron reverse transcriptase domain-containing protein [Candidatus Hydrogenedentes bacterium]|nr:group II intron reverse transcriptase domain-containing protein [Candidatus Hydrogenedentota bacterium]
MKRVGSLFWRVTAFENLCEAARLAQRSKRFREDVLAFNYGLEGQLHGLRDELRNKTYVPGPYRTFVIFEPKRRFISAAPYRDRVVHHALCNIIEPVFDAAFIDSCYANRKGKGSHKALDHFVSLARRYRYCLRADVEKYFPSMDHCVLKAIIRHRIKCPDTLWLIELILDHSNEQEPTGIYFEGDSLLTPAERRHGLPIGNLTSQLWANVYLNGVDHRLACAYGGRRYLRYVDDIALFSDDPRELEEARGALDASLAALRLRLHRAKTQILEVADGVNFLGFRVLPDRVRLRQDNLRRARRRMRQMQEDYRRGLISWAGVKESLQSWNAHAAYGDTWRLRERVFDSLPFVRG